METGTPNFTGFCEDYGYESVLSIIMYYADNGYYNGLNKMTIRIQEGERRTEIYKSEKWRPRKEKSRGNTI